MQITEKDLNETPETVELSDEERLMVVAEISHLFAMVVARRDTLKVFAP